MASLAPIDQFCANHAELSASISANDLSNVESFLEDPTIPIDLALAHATQQSRIDVVIALLKYRYLKPEEHCHLALKQASAHNHSHIIDVIIRVPGIDPVLEDGSVLCQAVSDGYVEVVRSLLSHPNTNVHWNENEAFTKAGSKGRNVIMGLLLKRSFDLKGGAFDPTSELHHLANSMAYKHKMSVVAIMSTRPQAIPRVLPDLTAPFTPLPYTPFHIPDDNTINSDSRTSTFWEAYRPDHTEWMSFCQKHVVTTKIAECFAARCCWLCLKEPSKKVFPVDGDVRMCNPCFYKKTVSAHFISEFDLSRLVSVPGKYLDPNTREQSKTLFYWKEHVNPLVKARYGLPSIDARLEYLANKTKEVKQQWCSVVEEFHQELIRTHGCTDEEWATLQHRQLSKCGTNPKRRNDKWLKRRLCALTTDLDYIRQHNYLQRRREHCEYLASKHPRTQVKAFSLRKERKKASAKLRH